MARSVLASTMSRFDSTERKNGQLRYISRSSSMLPFQLSAAVPKPYQPGSMSRDWLQLNTHGMARMSSTVCKARRGPAADIELRELGDRRRLLPVIDESRRAHQRSIGVERRCGELLHDLHMTRMALARRRPREARFERRRNQRLEIAPAGGGIGVLARDHLA